MMWKRTFNPSKNWNFLQIDGYAIWATQAQEEIQGTTSALNVFKTSDTLRFAAELV